LTSNATTCLIGSPAISSSIITTVNPLQPASVSIASNDADNTICAGTSVTFTATPTNGGTAPSYQWKLNGTNVGINSATYTTTTLANNDAVTVVMVSNATTCLIGSPATSTSIITTVNALQPASVSIASSDADNIICAGTSVTFTATPTNGGTTPSYQWKLNGTNVGTNSTTYTITNLANSDAVSVVMTSNATTCLIGSPATSALIVMNVNPLPNATISLNRSNICIGDASPVVSFKGVDATIPYIYTYSINGVTQSNITSVGVSASVSMNVPTTNTGTYIYQLLGVTEVSSLGCTNNIVSAIKTVKVNSLPTITILEADASGTINNDAIICAGATATLTGTGANTYTWTNGITNGNPFAPAITKIYTVTGTDINGCKNTASQTITVNLLPTVTATVSKPVICVGENVVLIGGGALSYTWDNGVLDAQSFTPMATKTYTVTGTDANGCSNTANKTIIVNPLPIVTINASKNAVCQGDGLSLLAGGANTYVWDNAVVDGVLFMPTTTKKYTVIGTDANGCANAASIIIPVNPLPTITTINTPSAGVIEGQTMNISGAVIIGAAPYTFVWSNSDPSIATIVGNATAFFSGIKRGSVLVSFKVTDNNNCTSAQSAVVTLSVYPAVVTFDLPNAFTPNGDNLNDFFKVVYNHYVSSLKSFVIFNRAGRVVFPLSGQSIDRGWDGRVNGVMQEADAYLWKAVLVTNGVEDIKTGSVLLLK
jgi:gliding motility-associated-like protein